ncbi:imidazolonepropionase [Pacificispira sp.]|uniref:imidazolonepropionase n=1 Tax=Pacificispira sp. TaxID=2888761 RepID=UPI003B51DCA1
MTSEGGFVLSDIRLATMAKGDKPYGLIEDGALAIDDGRIVYCGPRERLPTRFTDWPTEKGGRALATPALIDCHTHMVYGGDRAREFELRLEGASYEEIAKAGGGILSTVTATRAASEDDLVEATLPRLDSFIDEGAGAVEIKSGYGLTVADELKMLRAARRLSAERDVTIVTTFLAAHAIPPEFKDNSDGYIDLVCREMLPQAHDEGLVDAVDAFCENIAFSPVQVARVFETADDLGIPVKLHAEQLSNLGGAALAAGFKALSADHLEYLDAPGIEAMADAGTVAVLLPGAFYTLRETKLPPLQGLRDAGVPIAIATDCNPGSSPMFSPLLALNMACTLFRMTPEETLAGMTREGARALSLLKDRGTLEAGKRADIALWDVQHPAELAYRFGYNPLIRRIYGGEA